MRWLAVALALVVLSPPVAGEQPSRLEWLLDTRFTGTQVRLRAGAELRWQRDSAAAIQGVSLSDDDAFRRLRSKAGTRIYIGGNRVALAAYVKPEHLSPVVNRRAVVRTTAAAAGAPFTPRAPGVHLEPGARIEPGRRGNRATPVAIKRGAIDARGFLPNAVVATEFATAGESGPEREGQWRQIKPPAVLRVRPGAAVVARLVGKEPVGVKLLETRGKHALVVRDEERASAVGWVPVARLESGGGIGWGTIGTGRYGHRRVRLEAGTVLSDRVGGAPIGLITKAISARAYRARGSWREVEIPTEVGGLKVWASADRMSGGEKTKPE